MSVVLTALWCAMALAGEVEDAALAAARDAASLARYLTVEDLKSPLEAGLPSLASCPGFAQVPDGSVELRWRVAPGGEPRDLVLAGAVAATEGVARCIQARFLELRFPPHDEVAESVRAILAKQGAAFLPILDLQIEPRRVGPLFLKFPQGLSGAEVDAWARALGLAGEDGDVGPASP